MTFKTTLRKAWHVADKTTFDGYDVEDDMVEVKFVNLLDPTVYGANLVIDLSSYDQGEYTFPDQEVEIDTCGGCAVVDDEGDTYYFEFEVTRPINSGDFS